MEGRQMENTAAKTRLFGQKNGERGVKERMAMD
jgi:hypothetical protein